MIHTPSDPEKKILDAARQVFTTRGFSGTRMKEIASVAGINQALLHYYFRNKDLLFERVFQETIQEFLPLVVRLLEAEKPLDEKIHDLVHTYIDFLRSNSHVPIFIMHEITQNPDRLIRFVRNAPFKKPRLLIDQVMQGIQDGRYQSMDPVQFIVNVLSLCVFPFIARPMIQTVFEMEDPAFERFLEERKAQVIEFIINGMRKK